MPHSKLSNDHYIIDLLGRPAQAKSRATGVPTDLKHPLSEPRLGDGVTIQLNTGHYRHQSRRLQSLQAAWKNREK